MPPRNPETDMPLHIASSTITWNQFERPKYGDMLDIIREAGYSHVVAPGARRRPSTSGDDVPSTPEEILKVLSDHGLKPAPGYYSGPAYHDPANVAANVEGVRAAARHTRALG